MRAGGAGRTGCGGDDPKLARACAAGTLAPSACYTLPVTLSSLVRRPACGSRAGGCDRRGGPGLRARGPAVPTALATRRALEQHIVASGRVRVPTRVQVAAPTAGLVVAVGAVQGQRVAVGELLVQIDDANERAAVAQAEAAVRQAEAKVEQLRRVGAIVATQALRETQANLERAELDLARTSKLVDSKAVAASELDTAQHAVDIARAQRKAAEAQQVASAPMGADSRVALTALLAAQAQPAGAKVRLGQTRIVALQAGEVLTRAVEPGDVVQPTRTLMVLAADADYRAGVPARRAQPGVDRARPGREGLGRRLPAAGLRRHRQLHRAVDRSPARLG